MLKKNDSYVDGSTLVVIENPKNLSEEGLSSLCDMAKEKNLNFIEFKFKDEKGEVKRVTFPSKAEWLWGEQHPFYVP